jgi:hypothetical protein
MRQYIGAALAAGLLFAGLGAAAQAVWPGSIVASGRPPVTLTGNSTGSSWVTVSNGVPINTVNAVYLANGDIVHSADHLPPNALYHQVVDRYYDASGQEVETRSSSHVVGYDCHSGRRQQDLMVEDDGKGGAPRFVALLMGNEPTEGQKAITAEDKVKIILAANKGHTDDVVAPASVPATVTLAANR